MDKKPVQRPTGQPFCDDRGNSTWRWSGDLSTERLKALTDGMSIQEGPWQGGQPKNPDLDPYNKRVGKPKAESKPRLLDDMRRLSEEIKRKR